MKTNSMFPKAALASSLLILSNSITLAQTKQSLNSDQVPWKLVPQETIGADSVQLYRSGYDTSSWVKAVVPGAVFTSYVEAGVEKDPNFADNIYQVDKSKYNRNFWYRTELDITKQSGQHTWLQFEGINHKGEVIFNRSLPIV